MSRGKVKVEIEWSSSSHKNKYEAGTLLYGLKLEYAKEIKS